MSGPSAATAAVRVAVRDALAALSAAHGEPGGEAAERGARGELRGEAAARSRQAQDAVSRVDRGLVLVACSGGADSLALAVATAFVAPRMGWRAGLVTVDHQLQSGSAQRAAETAQWGLAQGFEPSLAVTVDVGAEGGPEAAARQARYRALSECAAAHGATAVLLGHTQDDQAETALLAMARGGGPRGLAGMPSVAGLYVRPLLNTSRATCVAVCREHGLTPWEDPHNADPAYARARVRASVMPALVEALGAGVVPNLARTAAMVARDSAYLDEVALKALEECRADDGLDVTVLAGLPDALRTRVLHRWALELGAPGAALSHRHVEAMDALVMNWHGQGSTQLPGGISVGRSQWSGLSLARL